jgi:hypothetical protein
MKTLLEQCQIKSSHGFKLSRWTICQDDQYWHLDHIIIVKGLLIWLLGQGQLIWSVMCHIADSAALTGLAFHPHRLDRSYQSAQNTNWTTPLRRSRRDDRNAYVEHPVRSPDEGVMVLARTNPAPDRSDWWSPTVWPVPAVKSELGVVFRHRICIGFDSYWGKTSPPYIYKGSRPIEGDTIESTITLYFLSLTTVFQPPCFSSLDLHNLRWRTRVCWST